MLDTSAKDNGISTIEESDNSERITEFVSV